MPTLEFTLETISPMFLNGADPRGHPEFRAASVRGQLRYWLRAILGAQTSDLKEVWERESSIFGSTAMGSAVSVRVLPGEVPKKWVADSPMLPHRRSSEFSTSAIRPGTRATLRLATRPGVAFPEEAMHALKIWALLGGLGKRSRRMFGAFTLTGDGIPTYNTPEEFATTIRKVLVAANCQNSTPRPGVPEFPMLHPSHSHIVVGMKPFLGADGWKLANYSLFNDFLRNRFRENFDMFGYAGSTEGKPQERKHLRRASPLTAQVRKIRGGFYPVITIMRSSLLTVDEYSAEDKRGIKRKYLKEYSEADQQDWEVLNRFVDEIRRQWGIAPIEWGAEFK